MPRLLALTTAAALALTALTGASAATAAPARSAQVDATALLQSLPVRAESHAASYERDRFSAWNDADRDGEDARAEVLKAESRTPAKLTGSGTVTAGRWASAYDGRVLTRAAQVEVDHVVALAEAWRSGAWKWSAARQEAFGNDLGFGHSLIAVSKTSNREKSDHDPSAWVPSDPDAACAYVKRYVAVKARWKLSVDALEQEALGAHLMRCDSPLVAKGGSPAIAALVGTDRPKAKPAPAPAPAPAAGGGGSTYYENCTAVRAAGADPVRTGDRGYARHLDRDGDGVGCE